MQNNTTDPCKISRLTRRLRWSARARRSFECSRSGKEQTGEFPERKNLMLALVGFDELSNFGAGSNRFNEDNVPLVQEHTVRPMPFVTTPHKSICDRLSIGINLTLYVVHVGQLWKSGACIDELAVVNLPIIQQDCSIGGRN